MGLVGETGAGPHDLLQMARRGRILDWAGESQYYVEPKRLAKLGYLEAQQEPAAPGRAPSTRSPSRAGRRCASGRRTPVTVTPLKSEPLLRLLIADLVGEDVTREALATLREDLADLRAAPRGQRGGGRGASAPRAVPAARQPLPARLRRAPRGAHRRASSTRFSGVSAARRTCAKPAWRSTAAIAASPAWVPRPARPGCDSEPGVQHMVEKP